jgi:hypothetical protein
MIERRPLRPPEREFCHDDKTPSDGEFLHDAETTPNTESAPATNGSGEVTRDSPLMDRLRYHEQRISTALTEPTTAADLAELLNDTDLAIIEAEQHAAAERDKSLDPTRSPDPIAARAAMEDALFMVGRLKTMRPRLSSRLQAATQEETVRDYVSKRNALAPERDRLEQALAETYSAAVGSLVDLFANIRRFQRQTAALGDLPANVMPLPPIRGLRLLDNCVLPDPAKPERSIWPPPQFAAFDMGIPPHPGAAWADPLVQQRKHDELAAEQQRHADFYSTAAKEQEERLNREEKQRFSER